MKILFTLITILAISEFASGFSLPSKSKTRADIVIPFIINNNFKNALSSVDSIIESDSKDPFPYILKLTVLGMRDVDFDRTIDSLEFLTTYRYAIKFSNLMETATGKSSYSRMMTGFCKAMHTAFHLRNKSYFSAMQNGFDALDILDEARKIDSSNTEVLIFLGLYDFARAELRSRLWWVLFWYPGDRKAGIEKLKQCSIHSTLTKTAAKLSLSEVCIKENKLHTADSLLKELEIQYPSSRFVLWSKVKFYEAKKDFCKAASVYESLAESYQKAPEGRYNYLVTKYQAAQMLKNSGQFNNAIASCQNLLNEPDLDRYKDLMKDTQRLLERVQNAENKS